MIEFPEIIDLVNPDFLKDLLEKYHLPGCSIGVFDRQRRIYINSGLRDATNQVTEDTSFRIASLTKPVFAYLVLKLVYEDILDLDIPLVEYYEKRYIEDELVNTLTTRHVLSHQSGWPNWAYSEPLKFEFEPGSKFQYSGEGIVYLQHTVEKITKKTVQELAEEYLFKPLKMNSSAFSPQFLRNNNRTNAHDVRGNLWDWRAERKLNRDMVAYIERMPRDSNAAGTMWSSMRDFTTFLHHLMFTSNQETNQIFTLLTKNQVYHPDWNIFWGLGIGLQKNNNQKAMWHWGSDNGFKTFTISFLDEMWGVSIFTNGENGFDVYSEILEMILPRLPNYIQAQREIKTTNN